MQPASDLAAFERILEYLRETRGFDFTAYKRTSLIRRVRKRMQAIDIDDFERYLDHLQVDSEEFVGLFNTILINVTGFFRDPEVWDCLRGTVLPRILAAHPSPGPIRVWSAGAASGEEPYSVAILLAELLGRETFKDRVKIYATDMDDEALDEARRAVYSERRVADVPPEFLAKYFDRSGDAYAFNRELRRSVIFGRHDLIQDAPISRVHLLLCRNTLMYFNSDAQSRIMERFYFSLDPTGALVLGRAEMLFSYASMFEPLDLKRRIFTVVPRAPHRDRRLIPGQAAREDLRSIPAIQDLLPCSSPPTTPRSCSTTPARSSR